MFVFRCCYGLFYIFLYCCVYYCCICFLAVRCVLEDLDEPIFSKLYTADWEQGEDIAHVLVVTLQDYFSDLSEWLYDYFFRSLLNELLCALIQRYVMCLRKKSNGVFTFQSQLMVTRRISEDRVVLLEFFEKYLADLGPLQDPDRFDQVRAE